MWHLTTSTQKVPRCPKISFKFRKNHLISDLWDAAIFVQFLYVHSCLFHYYTCLTAPANIVQSHPPDRPCKKPQSVGTDSKTKSRPLRVEPGALTSNRMILLSQHGKTPNILAFTWFTALTNSWAPSQAPLSGVRSILDPANLWLVDSSCGSCPLPCSFTPEGIIEWLSLCVTARQVSPFSFPIRR